MPKRKFPKPRALVVHKGREYRAVRFSGCEGEGRKVIHEARATIPGQPPHLKNELKAHNRGNYASIILSETARDYKAFWKAVVEPVPKHLIIEDPVILCVWIFYTSRRPDLAEDLVQDLLQGYLIKDDRQVYERHVYKWFDKESPRVEIEVRRLDPEAVKERERGLG